MNLDKYKSITKLEAIKAWAEGKKICVQDPFGEYEDGIYYMDFRGKIFSESVDNDELSIDDFGTHEVYFIAED